MPATPLLLLLAVTLVSGVLSAFLVNDTVCLVLTPLVLRVVVALRRDPVPYLLAVAMASNIGSTATITGNPQNMIIGSLASIPYATFTAALAPIAAIGLVLTVALIALSYRAEFWTRDRLEGLEEPIRIHRPIINKTVLVLLAMIAAFFLGYTPAKVAIVAGALLLLTRRIKPAKVYAEIDWTLLLMFAGLFVVVAGLEQGVFSPEMVAAVGPAASLGRGGLECVDGRALEPRQQRARRPRPRALRGPARRPAAGLARHRHGLDARRQPHHPGLGRQPHRRPACQERGRRGGLLGPCQDRRALDGADR